MQDTTCVNRNSGNEMYVQKRSGKLEVVSFDKISRRIRMLNEMKLNIECISDPAIAVSQSQQLNDNYKINYTDLAIKVIDQIYDGITTKELDILTAEQCMSLVTTHPDYGVLASRVVISNHHKNTESDFNAIVEKLYKYRDIHNQHFPIVSKELYDVVRENAAEIQSWFEWDRDYLIDFFGFKTLERAYLLRINGVIQERPQHMWMRAALGIHGTNLEKARETYDLMSLKYFTHATPTLFNAGTPRPQMSSCFLLAMEKDSLDGIYNTLSDCASISKWAGGIGLHIHNIRAKGSLIRGTNGASNGIVPMLRVFNNTARYVDQCFTALTLVQTTKGRIPISDVIPNETYVITGSGNPHRVLELVKHQARERSMRRITASQHPQPLNMTDEHLVLVFRNSKNIHPSEYNQDALITAYKSLLFGDNATPDVMYCETQNGLFGWVPAVSLTNNDYICSMRHGKLHYSRVDNIEQYMYDKEVYDLVVDTEHHYHTEVGVVHNGGGKRAGSFAIYLEPWHADVEDFLEMRKNHGNEELKARDLFYALWVPDLFMKRVEKNEHWSLMCPDECRGLSDVVGKEFEELYEKYERENKYKKQISARQLWLKICDSQIETGTPYLLYKDAANQKSNQQNIGTIKSSNLCVAPETKVLTREGERRIDSLVGMTIEVWNGEQFSKTQVRKTGVAQPLLRVQVDDGRMIDCTYYHTFYIEDAGEVKAIEAQHLKSGMKLLKWTGLNGQDIEHIVYEVIETGRRDDTYCFTEPIRHMGVFNGILTGQCTEIIEYSDENETAVCNLGSIALPRFVENPHTTGEMVIYSRSGCNYCKMAKSYLTRMNVEYSIINVDDDEIRKEVFDHLGQLSGRKINTVPQIVHRENGEKYIGGYEDLVTKIKPEFNYQKLHDITRVFTRNLNRVIDVNFYPTEKTRRSNMRHRPIGIGVQGLADTFALMNLAFDSTESRKINEDIFETIYHASLEESCQLAIEEGSYSTFEGSPASQGRLQFDLWEQSPSSRYNWNELRERIRENGLRNSLLVAPMPTASTSQILGFNECFEPFTSNIYMRRTLAGEFVIINKYLLRELVDIGLWNRQIKNKIISDNGSIQNIREIPESIRNRYKIVWELSMRTLIDYAAERGKYICQSQSMNLWMENPNYKALTSMHFYGWKRGLKTGIYYLRTKAKAAAQKFTVEPVKSIADTNTEEPCEMCSG